MSSQDSARVTPSSNDAKSVVWTPEDANRFLTAAIHQAQRPLEDQLKQRPITSNWFAIIVGVLVLGAAAIALIFSSQLEKTEARAEAVNQQREELLTAKVQLEAKSTLLEERLSNATEQLTELSGNGEELRTAKTDLARFRRQNELLRSQISGLEMEKVALARQLEAVKAMAIDDSIPEDEPALPLEGKGGTAAPAAEPAAPAEPVVEAVAEPVVVPEPVPAPEPVPESTTPPAPVAEPAPIAEPVGEPVIEPAPAEQFQAASEAYGEQLAQEGAEKTEPLSEPVPVPEESAEEAPAVTEAPAPAEEPKEVTEAPAADPVAPAEEVAQPAEEAPATPAEPVAEAETPAEEPAAEAETKAE